MSIQLSQSIVAGKSGEEGRVKTDDTIFGFYRIGTAWLGTGGRRAPPRLRQADYRVGLAYSFESKHHTKARRHEGKERIFEGGVVAKGAPRRKDPGRVLTGF
jgi:hypothetical protein